MGQAMNGTNALYLEPNYPVVHNFVLNTPSMCLLFYGKETYPNL